MPASNLQHKTVSPYTVPTSLEVTDVSEKHTASIVRAQQSEKNTHAE
jgi:hypothetical protein